MWYIDSTLSPKYELIALFVDVVIYIHNATLVSMSSDNIITAQDPGHMLIIWMCSKRVNLFKADSKSLCLDRLIIDKIMYSKIMLKVSGNSKKMIPKLDQMTI